MNWKRFLVAVFAALLAGRKNIRRRAVMAEAHSLGECWTWSPLHSTGLVGIGPGDPISFLFDNDGTRRRIGHDRGRGDDGKTPGAGGSTAILVPEPGALSLALFGLAAVAIFARRRRASAASA